MSGNLTLYDVGNDDDRVDERTSVNNMWNIILPNGTFQSWHGDNSNDDHITRQDKPLSPSLLSNTNETQAEMFQNLPHPPYPSFCTFYNPELKTYIRKDGFQISKGQDLNTVIMALHLSMVPQIHTVSAPSGAQQTSAIINTLFITPRLVFPIEGDTPSRNDWADSKKRDEASTSIDGSFWHLYLKGTLTDAIAGVTATTSNRMSQGEGNHLRKIIGTLVRDPKLNKTPDGQPGPIFHSVNRDVSTLAAVKLANGSISSLTIRLTGAVMGHPKDWANDTVFSKGDKATDGDMHLKLNSKQIKVLEAGIERYRRDHKHPPTIDRCVLGSVELWGPNTTTPDATSTIASSSMAAS